MPRSRSDVALGFVAMLALGCASTGTPGAISPRVYVTEGRTAKSEASVVACARSYTHSHGGFGSAALSDRIGIPAGTIGVPETTAYGTGSVSNSVYFRTGRSGDQTILTVFAESHSFPASGRGMENTNRVAVPTTPEAKARARSLIESCAGPS